MSWLTEPIIRAKRPQAPLWMRCKGCGAHVWLPEWRAAHQVCPRCNYHDSITAWERIALVFDADTFTELFADIHPVDALGFVDLKGSYADKIAESRQKTGLNEAVVTGHGAIGGVMAVAAVMDFRFLGGSLGSGAGEKILRAANFAHDHGLPYIVFAASGGARMQEGMLSLMQMAKTCAGVARLNRADLPFISVLTHPTTGGVSASFAMMGDLNIAEPGAVIGFAGRRVIEQTIGENLPADFQTAEYLLEHGFVDRIVNRKDMKEFLAKVLSFYQR
jgi:acetyl-CoA carboxylase carboxyl transferase subunit beta